MWHSAHRACRNEFLEYGVYPTGASYDKLNHHVALCHSGTGVILSLPGLAFTVILALDAGIYQNVYNEIVVSSTTMTRERKPDNDKLLCVILVQVRRKLFYSFSSRNFFEDISASFGYAKFLSVAVSEAILAKNLCVDFSAFFMSVLS